MIDLNWPLLTFTDEVTDKTKADKNGKNVSI